MRKLSLFQISLLAGFGAFAIAGVLIFAFAIGGDRGTSLGPVKIWGTLDGNAFSALIRSAAETNPSLSQVSYVQKDPATFEIDLTKALASGTGPDLFLITQDRAFKDMGQIAAIPQNAISRSQFKNTFIEAASPFYSDAKGALAIPLLADPLVLYWNKDLLASAGYSRPPAYWDEVYPIALKLTVRDSTDSIQKSAIAFGEYRNVKHPKDVLATLILQAGGAITGFDNTGRLVSSLVPRAGQGSQSSAENALRFYTQFADPAKDGYTWSRALPEDAQAFGAGQLAMYVGYASEESAITRSNPNLNFDVAPLPQARSGQSTMGTARVYALAASRAGLNPSAAITVAAALATTENSSALSQSLGIASARRDVLSAAAQNRIPVQLISQDDVCKGVDPVVCMAQISRAWVDPDPEATDEIFRTMIEQTTSGAALLTQALQRADQTLTQLLNQQQSSTQ